MAVPANQFDIEATCRPPEPLSGEFVVAFGVPSMRAYTVREPLIRCRDCTHYDEITGCVSMIVKDGSGTLFQPGDPDGFCFRAKPRASSLIAKVEP